MMRRENPFSITRICFEERFLFLLVSLLLYLGIAPFLQNVIALRKLMAVLFSVIFLSAIYAVSQNRSQSILAALLALPMFAATWLSNVSNWQVLPVVSKVFSVLFFLFAMVMILRYVMAAERITPNVIYAAIVIYLLIGVTGAVVYSLVELLAPGSFSLTDPNLQNGEYVFIYYSFVTLTTLGYGDISPLTNQARALVILQAVLGQLYLAVLVARLVGTYISQAKE